MAKSKAEKGLKGYMDRKYIVVVRSLGSYNLTLMSRQIIPSYKYINSKTKDVNWKIMRYSVENKQFLISFNFPLKPFSS